MGRSIPDFLFFGISNHTHAVYGDAKVITLFELDVCFTTFLVNLITQGPCIYGQLLLQNNQNLPLFILLLFTKCLKKPKKIWKFRLFFLFLSRYNYQLLKY